MAIIHITRHGPRWAGRGLAEGHQKGRVHRRNAECSALWATGGPSVHCGQQSGGHQSTVVVWVARQGNTGTGAGCWWPVIGCERSRKVLPHITTWTPQLAQLRGTTVINSEHTADQDRSSPALPANINCSCCCVEVDSRQ